MKTTNLENKIKNIINGYGEDETISFEGQDIICDGNRKFQYFEGTIEDLISAWEIEATKNDILVDKDTMLSSFNDGCYYCCEVEENVYLYRLF
jgi:hypothetical protein